VTGGDSATVLVSEKRSEIRDSVVGDWFRMPNGMMRTLSSDDLILVTSPEERLNEMTLADLSETNHFTPAPEQLMILKKKNNL
jgi:hypothetical protein